MEVSSLDNVSACSSRPRLKRKSVGCWKTRCVLSRFRVSRSALANSPLSQIGSEHVGVCPFFVSFFFPFFVFVFARARVCCVFRSFLLRRSALRAAASRARAPWWLPRVIVQRVHCTRDGHEDREVIVALRRRELPDCLPYVNART